MMFLLLNEKNLFYSGIGFKVVWMRWDARFFRPDGTLFRFFGFQVFWMRWDARFFRPEVMLYRFLGFKVVWMRWDARFFRPDRTLFMFLGFKVFCMGLDAELEKYKVSHKRSNLNGQWSLCLFQGRIFILYQILKMNVIIR